MADHPGPDPTPAPNPPPSYAATDFAIWQALAAGNPGGYLALDLYALTEGFLIPMVGPLADQIFAWPAAGSTVATLKQVTNAQWTGFFNAHPTWLPPFTQPVIPAASQPASSQTPGYTATRIRAFIRAVQKFFSVSSVATSAPAWSPGAPPSFLLPSYDPISLAAGDLPPSTSPPAATFLFSEGSSSAPR